MVILSIRLGSCIRRRRPNRIQSSWMLVRCMSLMLCSAKFSLWINYEICSLIKGSLALIVFYDFPYSYIFPTLDNSIIYVARGWNFLMNLLWVLHCLALRWLNCRIPSQFLLCTRPWRLDIWFIFGFSSLCSLRSFKTIELRWECSSSTLG